MFIHTRGSAMKRFAKFEWQKRAFCGKKRKKLLAQPSQTDYRKQLKCLTLYRSSPLVVAGRGNTDNFCLTNNHLL